MPIFLFAVVGTLKKNMAVWLMVWGKSNFKSHAELNDLVNKASLNLILDLAFLKEAQKLAIYTDAPQTINYEFDSKFWRVEIKKDETILKYCLESNSESTFYKGNEYNKWHFGISIKNDIISFFGPFEHFSRWNYVPNIELLRNGWFDVIHRIFKFLRVNKIIFFSEWGCYYEDIEYFSVLEKLLEEKPQYIVQTLKEIDDYTKFYIKSL